VVRILAAAVLLVSCASAAPPVAPAATRTFAELVAQFRYDASAPLATREVSTARVGAIAVTEIEYANARGGIAKATLLVPDGATRRPAVVMSPGSNQPREQLSSEGLGLAGDLGAVVLVVDQSQIAMQRARIWTFTAQDREEAIESVIDLRRGVDLLTARPDVDAARIGLHGFSYGAWLATMAAAVDDRATTVVLRSGGPQILREIAGASRAADPSFPAYLELMRAVDQTRYAPTIPARTAVLVQNGSADPTFTLDAMRAWQSAVGGAKTARMYDGAGHTLSVAADAERLTFLRDRWQVRAP
jgi:dienelactone hydrolase